jgi:hypothetical protein
MTANAETPRGQSGAFQEDPAVSGKSAATVPQPTGGPRGPQADALADWWTRAEVAWATSDFPEYGSPAWGALDDNDPCKLAAVLSAAERWNQAIGGGSPWASD